MKCIANTSTVASRTAVRPTASRAASRTSVIVRAQQQQQSQSQVPAALLAAGVAASLALAPGAHAFTNSNLTKAKQAEYEQQLAIMQSAFEAQLAAKSAKAPALQVADGAATAKAASQQQKKVLSN